MTQLYQTGKWIRNEYGHLISPEFRSTEIMIKSSDVDRTIMSGQALLAGLYQPTIANKFDENLPWVPVPIHTIPLKQDNVSAFIYLFILTI